MADSVKTATALLIEHDQEIARRLGEALESRGCRVWRAESGAAAEPLLNEACPDLIVLDLRLPDTDGLVLCANLRERTEVPIIIVGETKRKWDPILGYKLGADAFMAQPVALDELEARVEALLRRAAPQSPARHTSEPGSALQQYRVGELTIDHARRRVTVSDRTLQLTRTEYHLLLALASRPNEVLTRQELAQRVWGYYDVALDKAIDVHIRHLRAKLQFGAECPPPIVTVRGFGHKLVRETRGLPAPAA